MSAGQTLLLVVLQNAILLALTLGAFWAGVFVLRRTGRALSYSLSPLGLARPAGGMPVGLALGVAVGVGALAASIPINLATRFIFERMGYPVESTVQEPLMQGLRVWISENPAVAIPAAVLVVVIIGPAVEELVFRGALFNGLYRLGNLLGRRLGEPKAGRSAAEKASFALAAVLSSAVFALLHLEPVLLPALFLLSVGLCYLFARTGSLLPPFVAHAVFNSFATIVVILSAFDLVSPPV
ncbi:CPBP family intramembrane metalloprotease [Rubrobacter taiwanensis]|uniref:CPBP family intramembrane metalloprotease n=1 Tax=Rubrobacter taiwanensis TaxID=185139 RepID=A0A4R1BG69_9ACTN|nr:type II CAAX endopeptidase family protein [Rubrobacter taiwanensis]TCJ16058.1 CPBP family intramembrane metalloprotease [Rubrobacter taiwanensis]